MSIREARLNDVEAISPLFDAYRVFYEQTSDLDGAAQCLKEIFLVSEVMSSIRKVRQYSVLCGYIRFLLCGNAAVFVLYDLYGTDSTRKGVGTSLLRFAHDWAGTRRYSRGS